MREVGGARMYAWSRPIFYDGLDALLLVYDVSNVKSYHNLATWLFEICTASAPPSRRYWGRGAPAGQEDELAQALSEKHRRGHR